MLRHTPRLLLVAALTVGTASLVACATGPTVPVAGAELNEQFAKDFYPELKAGMKWIYVTTGESSSMETGTEVTEVKDGVATLKNWSSMANSTTTSTSPAKITVDFFKAFKSAGSEDVKVPAGEYKGAAKLEAKTNTADNKAYMWYAAGVGMVKSETSVTANGKTTVMKVELKEFKK